MFHYPFLSPLFGCSRGKIPPPTIIPNRDEYLLSRRNSTHFSQPKSFLPNFGITKTSGYDPLSRYQDNGSAYMMLYFFSFNSPSLSLFAFCLIVDKLHVIAWVLTAVINKQDFCTVLLSGFL